VRKLAEKTTSSSDDIAKVLDTVSSDADKAVAAMRQVMEEVRRGAESSTSANGKLAGIMAAAEHVSRLTHQIAAAASEQANSAQDTAHNMERVSAITQENNAVIQKIGDSAADLARVATDLQVAVSQFRVA
jgi:methyl-accepting chemotaxis protein